MRQSVGARKVAKYKRLTGLPVVGALVRGGTSHRVDLLLDDGSITQWYPFDASRTAFTTLRWRRPTEAELWRRLEALEQVA